MGTKDDDVQRYVQQSVIEEGRMNRFVKVAAILASMVVPASAQVARLEVHPVSSVTLQDFRFLGGSERRATRHARR